MFIKVSVPGQFRLKMMPSFRSFLMHRDGEVHYIGGTDILPAPFDSVREAEVLRKFGTSEDKEARSALIEHNLRLVVYIARKFDNTSVGVEDLISIGRSVLSRRSTRLTWIKILSWRPMHPVVLKMRF